MVDRKNVQKAAADHAEWRCTVRVDVAILYKQVLADAYAHKWARWILVCTTNKCTWTLTNRLHDQYSVKPQCYMRTKNLKRLSEGKPDNKTKQTWVTRRRTFSRRRFWTRASTIKTGSIQVREPKFAVHRLWGTGHTALIELRQQTRLTEIKWKTPQSQLEAV